MERFLLFPTNKDALANIESGMRHDGNSNLSWKLLILPVFLVGFKNSAHPWPRGPPTRHATNPKKISVDWLSPLSPSEEDVLVKTIQRKWKAKHPVLKVHLQIVVVEAIIIWWESLSTSEMEITIRNDHLQVSITQLNYTRICWRKLYVKSPRKSTRII